MTDRARIPTHDPCNHKWVGRTLRWCPDCDLVQTVEDESWTSGWASGWSEAILHIRLALKEMEASTYVRSTLQRAIDMANEDLMAK